MRKAVHLLWLLFVPILIALAYVGASQMQYTINEGKFERLKEAFDAFPHPNGTTSVLAFAEMGNYGAGEHCEYFAGDLRRSTLSPQALGQEYQSAIKTWRLDASSFRSSERKVKIVSTDKLQATLPLRPFDNFATAWKDAENRDQLYLIYVSLIEDGSCRDPLKGRLGF